MRTLNQSRKKPGERGRTFGLSNQKSTSKATTVGKFREKTLGLR